MFCSKCGSKVDDGAKFCNTCGNPIKQESKKVSPSLEDTIETKAVGETAKEAPKEETKVNETVKEIPVQEPKVQATPSGNYNAYNNNVYRAPKKPVNKKLIATIVGGVLAVCVVGYLVVSSLRTINLDKYVDVAATGYNGYGRVSYSNSDYSDKLYEAYGDKLTFDEEAYLKSLTKAFKILLKKANISPGLFDYNFTYYSYKYSQDEAPELLAQAYANQTYYDSPIDMLNYHTVYFDVESSNNLKNGDKINLVWYDIDYELEQLKAMSKGSYIDEGKLNNTTVELLECLYWGGLSDEEAASLVYDFVKSTNPTKFFNYKFKYSNKTITVKDLTEAPTVDIFNNIELKYSGIAPNGSAQIVFNGKEVDSLDGINFSVSNGHSMYDGLDVGDVITATLSYDDVSKYINEYGGVPSTSSKEFTVDALDSLLTSASQIPSTALEDMKGKADGAFRYIFEDANQTGNSLEEFNYKGLYVLTRKDSYYNTIHADSKYYYDIDDKVILVYEVKVRNSGGSYDEVNTIYWCAAFDNILVKADGSLEYDIDTYHTPNNQINITGDNQNWFYYAYNSLDDLYNNQVAKNTDDYYVEESMQ